MAARLRTPRRARAGALLIPPRAAGRERGTSPSGVDAAGLIAGRYRVVQKLGEGGMASVWKVGDEQTGRSLAMKRLSRNSDARHVALFEREYHTLASLRHPSIVEAYDYESDALGPFYTMELLEGTDVSKLAPMPWTDVCRILRDLASGLALLHARRLLHRDVSARNAWLMPDGRAKLIDFGTMATFGRRDEFAGTTPFIAPESLRGLELDQRTDLYSLGALGYFLLTGRHAFAARSPEELESMWKQRPRSAGRRVAELERADLPDLPGALETLVDRLLSDDPLARPTTAADVIDRLQVIASLESNAPVRVLESYLTSPLFVGRAPERDALRAALAAAASGKATSAIVEGPSGLGRTRLLQELALEARLAGAVVLQAAPHGHRETLGVAQEFALRLLAGLPAAALAAAAPYARVLGHVSPALRDRLTLAAGDLAEMPQAPGEARMRVQAALRDWFLDVARQHTLVIVADDFEAFDEASAAWLTALAREATAHGLMVLAALRTDGADFPLAVQALRQSAIRLVLRPLSPDETSSLFRSVFGDVQHLARFVDRVEQRAEGNPGHAIDIAEHLCREGVVAYAEGTWVLPQSLDAAALPANRLDAEIARIGRLPEPARKLGQSLSLREGPIPLEMCAALADGERHVFFNALEALVREGVLAGSADGYRFSRESLRAALQPEFDEDRRRATHRRLGTFLLASADLSELERLKAGVHLLLGGDDQGGSPVVARAGRHYGLVEIADLAPAVPSFETALARFRARGRSPHEIASILAPLALAGYYADRRLATLYGKDAVDVLQTIVGLKLARRLRGLLGRKLGLLVALAVAAFGFAIRSRNRLVPNFREAMMMLFNCVAALTGVCTICTDPAAGRGYASVLEPMTALGRDHVATFMHEFCLNLVATVEDRLGEARARWQRMIARLDQPEAVRDLPRHVHGLYLGGALYAGGVLECWRDDSRALEYASRLENLKLKLYEMSADQVRMVYYANRGNFELFERYRARVEVHAIQRGTAWQVETWTQSGLITVYLRTQDAARLKECVEQLKRLSAEVPSLGYAYKRALGAYLVLRGTPEEALHVLGQDEEPLALVGWARGEGVRARAHNALGDHASARDTCVRALSHLSEEDLKFCAMNQGLQIELARAEAGLGHVALAEEQLRSLLAAYEGAGNPLTVGALHEALADLAALRGDSRAFVDHLGEVDHWFRQTRNPALVARYERLSRDAVRASLGSDSEDARRRPSEAPPRLMTLVHRLRHGGEHTLTRSAQWALQQLTEFTDVREAYLFLSEAGEATCAARMGGDENLGVLCRWVGERLGATLYDSETVATRTGVAADPNRLEVGGTVFRLTRLLAPTDSGDARDEVVGAVVLSGDKTVPFSVVQTIAQRLRSVGGA
jgi:Protein kinase domain/AAA ATPase domain